MMTLKFTKMHGLGNDFIVIDGVNQNVCLRPSDIQQLSVRETGIGFDQCLIIETSHDPDIDFFYRIYNSNGQAVGQCGNGARCIARFIQRHGLSSKKILKVATLTTQLTLTLNPDDTVTVDMGIPRFLPALIPLTMPAEQKAYLIPLDDDSSTLLVHALSIGNPHAVIIVDDLEIAPVASLGKKISEHPLFPEQVNVGFMKINSQDHISLRVYERACGETRACGSGAVAAAAAAMRFHHLNNRIKVTLTGGELVIDWPDKAGPIFMTGPAEFSFEGCL